MALICREPTWNPIRSYLTDVSGGRSNIAPENVSAPQHLVQGTKYFFTGYLKAGDSVGNFGVAGRVVTDSPPTDGSFPIFNGAVIASELHLCRRARQVQWELPLLLMLR